MDVNDLRRAVLATPGATWETSKKTHFIVRVNGVRICTVPSTASDTRSMKNTVAQLRRGGINIPRK
jgi:hypothetical protein